MEWINLRVATIRQSEYVGSEPISRATWFNVLAYCIEQENDGVIPGAAQWRDRQWQQACGVMAKEVRDATPLLHFVGDDLHVWHYPSEKQDEVQARREAGRKGGQRSGRIRAKQKGSTASSKPEAPVEADPKQNRTEWNGTEGNGRGMEEEDLSAARSGREREIAGIPSSLHTGPFIAAWSVWVDYCTERNFNRAVPSQTFEAHLRTCIALGPEAGAAALRNAIARQLREPAPALKILEGAAAPESFDPTQPHAHTGGAAEAR